MKKKGSSTSETGRKEFKDALERAATYCSRRETSSGQLRLKLKEWEVPEEFWEPLVIKLVEQKFVDDRRFAELFVREKFRLNRWGRIKIAYMLRQQGIGEELIQQSLETIDEESYERVCRELIAARSPRIKEKNPYSRKGKLYRYVSGRGFEADLIYRILNSELPD